MNIKLSDLSIGDKAVISGYAKSGERYRQKILAMGLTRGTEIQLTQYAPLGDPVELLVRGFKLSLRKEEAAILQLKGDEDE